MAIPFFAAARDTKLFALRKWIKVGFVWAASFQRNWEDHFLESKKPMCLRHLKWDCCSDLFSQNCPSFNKQQCFCKSNGMAGSWEHVFWLKVSSPTCMLPIFAKAPCCLVLFGCCCRRLSQHGVGEVLILLRHFWQDAFFCVYVGSGSFCQDWASHCSILFWSLDALFIFGFLPLPPRLLTRELCGSGCVCRPEFSIIRLKNNSIY